MYAAIFNEVQRANEIREKLKPQQYVFIVDIDMLCPIHKKHLPSIK